MQVLDDIGLKKHPPKRLDVLFNIALCSILLGAAIGASIAWFNAWMSPHYFQETMGWNQEEVRPASLIQGGLNGMAYGFAFAGFFAIVCGWATQFKCSFLFAFRQLLKISFFVFLGWAAGGLIESSFYQPMENALTFSSVFSVLPGAPATDWHSRWVQGSILGQNAGFLLGAAFCPLIVWRAWRRRTRNK